MTYQIWTSDEDDVLRAEYPLLGALGCAPKLQNRTLNAIRIRANHLKLKAPKYVPPSTNCKDRSEEKFNRLLLINRVVKDDGSVWYNCKCDCGTIKLIRYTSIISGGTRSCGCLNTEQRKKQWLVNSKTNSIKTKKPPGESTEQHIWSTYISNARKRKLEFTLTREEFNKLIHSPCAYCGVVDSSITINKRHNDFLYHNGIDRIDNIIGYTLVNCVPCCFTCNRAKWSLAVEEFEDWLNRLVLFRNKPRLEMTKIGLVHHMTSCTTTLCDQLCIVQKYKF